MKGIAIFLFLFCCLNGATWSSSLDSGMTVTVTFVNQQTAKLNIAPLSFGVYVSGSPQPAEATATIQLNVVQATPITITFDQGLYGFHAIGTFRAMSDGNGHYLSYDVYQDPSHSILWGNRSFGSAVSVTGTGKTQTISVYGYIPEGQSLDLPAETKVQFSDQLLATIDF